MEDAYKHWFSSGTLLWLLVMPRRLPASRRCAGGASLRITGQQVSIDIASACRGSWGFLLQPMHSEPLFYTRVPPCTFARSN